MTTQVPAVPDPATDFLASPSINSPEAYLNVTPSDTVNMPFRCRVVWCGAGGNIAFMGRDGVTVCTMTGVPGNQWVLLRTNRIMATGSTATGILAAV